LRTESRERAPDDSLIYYVSPVKIRNEGSFFMSVKSKEEILAALNDVMNRHAQEYHLKRVGLFGSYARSEQNEVSDVDVLVEFSESPDLFDFLKFEEFLEKTLGVKVEAVRKEALRPELKDRILSETIYI